MSAYGAGQQTSAYGAGQTSAYGAGQTSAYDAGQQTSTYGTGLQTTRVTRLPDGTVRWSHSRGSNHPAPYPPVPHDFTTRAHAASDDALRFATPVEADAQHGTWDTAGSRSAARLLLTGDGASEQDGRDGPDEPDGPVGSMLGRLGARLRVLHTARPVTAYLGEYPPPPGLTRFQPWLDGGRGTRAGAGFHYRLRSSLGPDRLAKLREFTETLLRATDADTVLHGWLTLGNIVMPDDPGPGRPAVVLSGLEAARGRPETDIGWIVGEIEEFRRTAELASTPRPLLPGLTTAFLEGYGPGGWDRDVVAAGAVVRIATHAHDFANYVGWHASLHTYVPMLADLLDSDGNTALPDP
ncbi:hypothetical protein J7F03_03515 [Streptomyces sp. ISL-43]|uniref:hypothetical protein n=1 Tax=Streptomyces sp. ISL-43 TaxID=2819183 RepID=UPI001BE6D884|nr:hypothetical protein [Streptomyces sp. ISL-43]MBT2446175.1 hypothetical protein [Streptomyces sp. ISL-43]